MFLFFVCVKNIRNTLESSTYCRIQVDVLGEFMAGIVLVNAKKIYIYIRDSMDPCCTVTCWSG